MRLGYVALIETSTQAMLDVGVTIILLQMLVLTVLTPNHDDWCSGSWPGPKLPILAIEDAAAGLAPWHCQVGDALVYGLDLAVLEKT